MGYLLRMSGEIRDWLADLRDSDPPAALLVGSALVVLISEGASLGPPLVISLRGSLEVVGWPAALDHSYQDRLERLQVVRRRVADAATLARDIQRQVTGLESLEAELQDQRWRDLAEGRPEAAKETVSRLGTAQAQLAELRRLLPGVTEAERQLTAAGQRAQAQVDAFRTRKEVLKATYEAARAEREVDDAFAASGRGPGNADESDGKDSGARDPGGGQYDGRDVPVGEAADNLREITAEIESELAREVSAEDLMELRPGAPGARDDDIRILFAVEPHGTALLIAVLEGREAVEDQRSEAVVLSADLLRRARAGQAPEAAAYGFDDVPSFLDEFFPGSADEVEVGAAALAAGNRARTLAEQRIQRGLTQAQVAQRMGVRQERVSAIERAEPGATEVRTLAGYVEALGGRLEIIADFGEERVLLR